MDRRTFLKYLGIGAASTTAFVGCNNNRDYVSGSLIAKGEVPVDKMTYRH